MSEDERFAQALQSIEDDLSGGVVTSFLVVAEVAVPDDPDSALYRLARYGSPAMLLGLSAYLGSEVARDVEEGMEDG